jgi:ferrous iron transport protein B
VFASLWTTGLGYGAAVLAYQAGTFGRDPLRASAWIGAILLLFAATMLVFRMAGERGAGRRPMTATAAE